MPRKSKKRKLAEKRLEEMVWDKLERLSLEETMKFGLWISTSIMAYPILKAADTLNASLLQVTNTLEAFSPWRGEFWTDGLFFIRDFIIGKIHPDTATVETSDTAIVLLSVIVAYYIVFHPDAVSRMAVDILGLARLILAI